MPVWFENICLCCGQKYKGRGKFYCSNQCAAKIENPKRKDKFSAAHKGKRYRLGTKQPASFKEMMRQRMTGKGNPNKRPEIRAKHIGSHNAAWRGGVTPIHQRIRTSAKYQEWRQKVFEQDNYTCQHCGRKGGDLHADHIKSFAEYSELRFDVNNGRTLCVKCHRKTGNYGYKKKVS